MNWKLAVIVFFDILIRNKENGINIYIFADDEIEKYIKADKDEKSDEEFNYVTEIEEIKDPIKKKFPIFYMSERI